MRVIGGDLLFGNGAGSVPVPRASVLHAGWGAVTGTQVLDDSRQPLPDSLDVLFFSYLEDKIYRGTFALPKDSIVRLFRDGYPLKASGRSSHSTFSNLVVGVAPGGAVSVWASGEERQVEVFFGQAQAVDLDWHRTLEVPTTADRESYVARVLTESSRGDSLVPLMRQNVPLTRWATYRARYRWRPRFVGLQQAGLRQVAFVNGEFVGEDVAFDFAAQPRMPVPVSIALDDTAAHRYYRIALDEEEVVAAFVRLAKEDEQLELVFSAPAAGGASTKPPLVVSVRNASESVVLSKSDIDSRSMR